MMSGRLESEGTYVVACLAVLDQLAVSDLAELAVELHDFFLGSRSGQIYNKKIGPVTIVAAS